MKIINNQNRIAKFINKLHIDGVEAVGDDGNVCVQILGDKDKVKDVVDTLYSLEYVNTVTGDGVQEGCVFINGIDIGLHEEIDDAFHSLKSE